MRNLSMTGAALLLSILVPSAGWAQTVGSIAAAPSSVPVGAATPVRVTVVITDPAVVPGSVVLQRIDDAGRVLATVGTLNDGGTAGDQAAGDKTFSVQPSIYEIAPGSVRLRVSAAFAGRLTRVLSAPVLVQVVGASQVLTLTQPRNLAYLSVSPVQVTGTVGTPNTPVTINGIAAVVNGGSFSAQVPMLEGTNTLTAVAANGDGSVTTASVQVTLDTTPPRLSITTPESAFITTASSLNVSGIVNDIVVGTVNDVQAAVVVNGVAAQVANRSFLAASVPLVLGPNTVQATATDRAGNHTTATVTVERRAATGGRIAVVSGNLQTRPAGSVLPTPLVVQVLNAANQPVFNQAVVFRVTENSGGLVNGIERLGTHAVQTNAQGQASVQFQLGSRSGVGNNVVEANATGFTGPAIFTHSGTPTAAARIVVDTGNGQTGVVGQNLPLAFIAIVTDAGYNRLANVPVTFTVRQGGGALAGKPTLTGMTDSDGRVAAVLTLGQQEGQDNNVVEATFSANPGQPAAFLASSLVPGNPAQTSITGVVLDNANQPIPDVTMRLFRTHFNTGLPESVATPVKTDGAGQFVLAGVPVGAFKLMADGSTAGNGPWPTLEFDVVTVAGRRIDVGLPIYLPRLDETGKLCVDETTGGTLTLPKVPGFALTIAPGSATFPGGSRTGCVTVTPVNGDKVPMSPGFGQQPRFVVTIQPVGTLFNAPARLTLPNVDGLAPRAVTEMYSYDHDLAAFVSIGTGTVSEDGALISSDPGVGVIKAGWHCGGNPNPVGSAGTCKSCEKCVGTNCVADNSKTPAQTSDKDCKKEVCTGGAVTTVANDGEQPGNCKTCKNGEVKDFSPSGFIVDQSLSAQAKLPDNLLQSANSMLQKIGVPLTFNKAEAGFTGLARDCCNPADGQVVENGEKEGKINVTLSAALKDFQLWPQPPTMIDKTWDVTVFGEIVSVRILFMAGVFFSTDLTLSGEGGIRTSACADTCGFGGLTGGITSAFKVQVAAQACVDSTLTQQYCTPTIDVSIAPLVLTIQGNVGYNQGKCTDGISGSVKVVGVKFVVEFELPLLPKLVYEATIFDGFCVIGSCT